MSVPHEEFFTWEVLLSTRRLLPSCGPTKEIPNTNKVILDGLAALLCYAPTVAHSMEWLPSLLFDKYSHFHTVFDSHYKYASCRHEGCRESSCDTTWSFYASWDYLTWDYYKKSSEKMAARNKNETFINCGFGRFHLSSPDFHDIAQQFSKDSNPGSKGVYRKYWMKSVVSLPESWGRPEKRQMESIMFTREKSPPRKKPKCSDKESSRSCRSEYVLGQDSRYSHELGLAGMR